MNTPTFDLPSLPFLHQLRIESLPFTGHLGAHRTTSVTIFLARCRCESWPHSGHQGRSAQHRPCGQVPATPQRAACPPTKPPGFDASVTACSLPPRHSSSPSHVNCQLHRPHAPRAFQPRLWHQLTVRVQSKVGAHSGSSLGNAIVRPPKSSPMRTKRSNGLGRPSLTMKVDSSKR